jgi:putative spermidine/putrescine transport system ATP-binding protein
MELERTSVQILQCAKTYPDGTQGLLPSSLDVHPGEVLALLGPSGCGKTTLLRLIAGLETVDSGGIIRFGPQEVTDVPVERRQIGMVFQHYALFPQMTVQANIGYGLRIRGTSEQQLKQTVGELIDLVQLKGLEHKRPAELSGGQRQRVALARAVAVRPKVLLLDEPLTALDAKLKVTLRDELADLLRRLGITTIHVTHDQQEALAIADRLAVMRSGKIIQVGEGEALYRNPKHMFVAEFLGRINRLQRTPQDIVHHTVNIAQVPVRCPPGPWPELFVRPEDIELKPYDRQQPAATITQRTFLGDRIHYRLEVVGQGALTAEAHRDSPYLVGDRVSFTIAPEHFMPCENDE